MRQGSNSFYSMSSDSSSNFGGQVVTDSIPNSDRSNRYSNPISRNSSVPLPYNGGNNVSSGQGVANRTNNPNSMATVSGTHNVNPSPPNPTVGRSNSVPTAPPNAPWANIPIRSRTIRRNDSNDSTDTISANRYRIPNRQLSTPSNYSTNVGNQSEMLRLQQELIRYNNSLQSRLSNSPRFAYQPGSGTNRDGGLTSNTQGLTPNRANTTSGNSTGGPNNNHSTPNSNRNANSPPGININNYYVPNPQHNRINQNSAPVPPNIPAYGINPMIRGNSNNTHNLSSRGSTNYFNPGVSRTPTSSRPSNPNSYPNSVRSSSRNSSPRQNNYLHRSIGNTFTVSSNNTNYLFRNSSSTTNNTNGSINIMSIPTRSINLVEPVEIRLPPEIIESFPVNSFICNSNEVSDGSKTCSVCLEDYQEGDQVKRLPCTHFYHKSCIDVWLNKSTICPICKFDFIIMLQI